MITHAAVKMIKQFTERVWCYSLSFHGDVVYMGDYESIILWNGVTDVVVRLHGYLRLILSHICSAWHYTVLVFVHGFDVSPDGSVVVGSSKNGVIAHNTATGAVLWRKEMLGEIWALRIHGGVLVVPVDNSNTVVLDVTTGHQLHTLPSAGANVRGVFLFDGLTSDVTFFVDFLTP